MKVRLEIHQSHKRPILAGCCFAGFMLFFAFSPKTTFAGLLLNAELRFTYEDNVVGLLSDQPRGAGGGGTSGSMPMQAMGIGGMGGNPDRSRYTGAGSGSTRSPADFHATISAEASGYTDVGTNMSAFAKGFANHSSYNTYTDLNATIGGVSAELITSLGARVTALGSVVGRIKRFGDSQRNSTAYAGKISLKQKLTRSFWLREHGLYEKNNADFAVFSYTGTMIGAGMGYALATLGYNYLIRKFDEPSGAEIKSNTFYVSAEYSFTKSWAVTGEYDLQLSKENITGSSTKDNIFSLALKYSH